MNKKYAVLLSGGLDSACNAFKAKSDGDIVLYSIIFNYGQIAWENELNSAKKISQSIGAKCLQYDISHLFTDIENIDYPVNVDLNNNVETQESMKSVWIPNRNGLMINAAAAVLEKLDIKYLLCGFNKEEAETFSDNSVEFIDAINESLKYSTSNGVEVCSFTHDMTKDDIIKEMLESDFSLDDIWSCYLGGEKMCGTCESCLRLKRALSNNRKIDEYSYLFT
ncbi:7-cyano-7-deazaguanine synthase [bacterium]|nr:7-cyano-7-deazaguanine synthase [bacterium]